MIDEAVWGEPLICSDVLVLVVAAVLMSLSTVGRLSVRVSSVRETGSLMCRD